MTNRKTQEFNSLYKQIKKILKNQTFCLTYTETNCKWCFYREYLPIKKIKEKRISEKTVSEKTISIFIPSQIKNKDDFYFKGTPEKILSKVYEYIGVEV